MPRYDLRERTLCFAQNCRDIALFLPKTLDNIEYAKQLIRSSASQAANYIEANEAISKRDFLHRIKICIKETKESILWLELCRPNSESLNARRSTLLAEGEELRKIFGAIFIKGQRPGK